MILVSLRVQDITPIFWWHTDNLRLYSNLEIKRRIRPKIFFFKISIIRLSFSEWFEPPPDCLLLCFNLLLRKAFCNHFRQLTTSSSNPQGVREDCWLAEEEGTKRRLRIQADRPCWEFFDESFPAKISFNTLNSYGVPYSVRKPIVYKPPAFT